MYSLKDTSKCPTILSCPIYSLLRKSRLNASVPFSPRSVLSRYTLMVIALYFCHGAQFTQTFCIHVFAEGCTYVSYDMKLSDLFPAS